MCVAMVVIDGGDDDDDGVGVAGDGVGWLELDNDVGMLEEWIEDTDPWGDTVALLDIHLLDYPLAVGSRCRFKFGEAYFMCK